MENSGIIECIYEGNNCFRFDKLKYYDYISKHQEKADEIEIMTNDNFDDE